MKLSDIRNSAQGKLTTLREAARQTDLGGFPTRLGVVALLPFVVCLIILLSVPAIESKLLHQSIMTAVVFWAIGGALYAGAQYVAEHQAGERSSSLRALLQIALTLGAVLVLVLIMSRIH